MRSVLIWTIAALVTATTSAFAASSDEALQQKGRNFAPSRDGVSPIYQIVSALQQSIQQADLEQLLSLFVTDLTTGELESLPLDVVAPIAERLQYADSLLPVTGGDAAVMRYTGFSDFNLIVTSIERSEMSATVDVRNSWGSVAKGGVPFRLSLAETGPRWHLASVAEVLQLLDDYLGSPVFTGRIAEDQSRLKLITSSTDRALTVASVSDNMLQPQNFWETPTVGRINRNISRTRIQENVDIMGCANATSSYINIDGNLTTDLVALSDECWRRIVVMDDHQEYLIATGHQGYGATLEDFAAPKGMEFLNSGMLYVTEDYNNRVKLISVSTAVEQHLRLFKLLRTRKIGCTERGVKRATRLERIRRCL